MNDKILVTYASRTGATAEAAQLIGETLRQGGAQVDVLPMQEVKDLTGYRAVAVGSAIRGSKWLPEAMQFMQTQQTALAQKRVAIFTVCITMAMKNAEKYRQGVAAWIEPARALAQPVSEGIFAGRLDFSKLPLNKDTIGLRLAVAFGVFPKGDHRDWQAIRAWADELRTKLG